jgi:aminoglycoside phosphotransferase family enzyme/predicted kinase
VSSNPADVPGEPAATDQREVFAFLADPATHGRPGPVRRIDTHAAVVFLAGADAYKLKRAIRLPFLDQTTLAQRRHACESELRVNRTFTPALYRGVVPITRRGGRLRLGGEGEVVDWAVHMRRFDENQTLDLVAERGELTADLIAAVATLILDSHAGAAVVPTGAAALEGVIAETLEEIVETTEVFPPAAAQALATDMRAAYARNRALLAARARDGRVRRCHGDLHLRNIALVDGAPVLFDAIEFDEAIATIDVLYDLAFAVMDLCERDLVAEANLLLNRYLWGCTDLGGELAGLAALPLFLSLRAAVHAKIDAIRFLRIEAAPAIRAQAERYFAVAETFLQTRPPVLVAVGGLSGTGKTTLAAALAPTLGAMPGAVHLRSDIERKRQHGVAELARLPDAAYGAAATERVYAALRAQAAVALGAGQSVVVDAVHAAGPERDAIAAVAAAAGARFHGLWLEAPVDRLVARVGGRHRDASDATAEVVARQAGFAVGDIRWTRLDASPEPAAVLAAARAACTDRSRPSPR